jgi:hypothetical protein
MVDPDYMLLPSLPGTFSLYPIHLPSKDETFLTLSFGAEDKPNNNNFNNFISEIRSSTRTSCTLLCKDLD